MSGTERRREGMLTGGLVLAVLLFLTWRATVGASLYDDSYYVVTALRTARGARPFVDELAPQGVAQFVSVPFVAAWNAVAGLTGLVLAVRTYYLVLAAAVGFVVWRCLRPAFGAFVPACAIAVILLAPPYHVLEPSYDTVAELTLLLVVALGFAALRSRSAGTAAAAGAATGLLAVTHPALAPAAVVLVVTFAVLAHDRRLAVVAVGAAVLPVVAAAAWLLATVPAADAQRALPYAAASVQAGAAPLDRVVSLAGKAAASFAGPWTWPMWALAAAASMPRLGPRVRVLGLVALPVAAALPGAVLLARGDHFSFGVYAPAWVVLFALAASAPVLVAVVRGEPETEDLRPLLLLAAPAALIGALTIAWVSNASWNRALIVVPLAPLALGILVGWGVLLGRDSRRALYAASAIAIVTAAALLTATVWAEFPGPATARMDHGPYAGIAVTARRRAQLLALEAAGRDYVKPTDKVLFIGEPEGYLLVGGVIDTPAVWLVLGPVDRLVLSDLTARGMLPDVVFVDDTGVNQLGGVATAAAKDPLIALVTSRYSRVGSAAGFTIYRRR